MINQRLVTTLLLAATTALAGCSKKKNNDPAANPTEGSGTAAAGSGTGGTAPVPTGGGVIKIDGSSTVVPISEAVAEEFDKAGKGQAAVGESGTGGGFQKFCRGETDISDASRPIKSSEADACKAAGIEFIELPIAYDGLAVVVHKNNKFVDHLTVAELKKMWEPESKVASWKDVRAGFPDQKLTLYGAGTDSGTYDYFTQAIVGKEHSSRGDYTASENDNVLVQGVSGDTNALGFFGLAYYTENSDKLKLVPIDDGNDANGKGPIVPDTKTVADGTYQPLSRPLFIYVSTKSLDKPIVQQFVAFYLEKAKSLVGEVGYIPLPDKAYELATARLNGKKTGSMFTGGSQIGVSLEQLMAAEGK